MDMTADFYSPAPYVREISDLYITRPKTIGETVFGVQTEGTQTNSKMQTISTEFASDKVVFKKTASLTGESHQHRANLARASAQSDLDRIARARVQLLAKQYAGADNVEISARLDMLASQLNRLLPRVSSAQIDSLAESIRFLAEDQEDLRMEMSDLGISI